MTVRIGSASDLRERGFLTGKVGAVPVVVFLDDDRAYAVDDRCPHMGFPLHRGTVENGLVTCHWHHARFDLCSGGTLDPFADDVRAYEVRIDADDVLVVPPRHDDRVEHLHARIDEGLEQGLSLVLAKAVLGLQEAGVADSQIVRQGVEFGLRNRAAGWGTGLTVLSGMANLLPQLRAEDRALALVHGLTFVSRDTRGRPPRFALAPRETDAIEPDRLAAWYRRFVETRSEDAAERSLVTLVASAGVETTAAAMYAAATDHVFLDEGHVVDFTTKAIEVLDHLGPSAATDVLPALVHMTAAARRHEEEGQWRHPHDLVALLEASIERLPKLLSEAARTPWTDADVSRLGWALLADNPAEVVAALDDAIGGGASFEQVGRAVALAAGLRITRFHTQNDHGDWDVVHHGFTAANALHQGLVRAPSTPLLRGAYHGALKVYLDRFLNIPPARLPSATTGDLADLQGCWDAQGMVDEAGAIVFGFLQAGGSRADAIAALGGALLHEDAGFHWYQVVEAGARQAAAWPEGSHEAALLLAGVARFLAAHTPTRRELPKVVQIATRLRRGEPLYEEDEDPAAAS